MLNDLRFAIRMLTKSPGYTAIAVLTLALCIGGTTAIYSVVNAVILNPIPGPSPQRILQIGRLINQSDGTQTYSGMSPPEVVALRGAQDAFAQFAWSNQAALARKTDDFIDMMYGCRVSTSFFDVWSIPPLLGRTFAKDDTPPPTEDVSVGPDSVIVLGYDTWKSVYNEDRSVIGKSIELGKRHFTVIGVMPDHFRFPWGSARFWIPAADPVVTANRMEAPNYQIFVRLKPGGSEHQVGALLDVIKARLLEEHANDKWGYGIDWREEKGWGFHLFVRQVRLMFADNAQDLQRTLFGLFGAIAFVLLIGCANIANLMLAKTEQRQLELSIRAAIGAGRGRLIRQLLSESILLACIGGVGGLIVAVWGTNLLAWLVPRYMPRMSEIHVDGSALAFSAAVSIATGILFGLAPAWRAARARRLNDSLKLGNSTVSPGGRRLSGLLVIAEIALAFVLMAGAGLMTSSVIRMLHVNPGFDPENLLGISCQLDFRKYAGPDNNDVKNAAFARISDHLAAIPGVTAVGILKYGMIAREYEVDGRTDRIQMEDAGVGVGQTDVFRAMHIPLLAGRYFDAGDIGETTRAAIINETMARQVWPSARGVNSAIGKIFREPAGTRNKTYEVVGVVADTLMGDLGQKSEPMFYRPYHEYDYVGSAPFFAVRTQRDPTGLIPAIRKELLAAEPTMQTPSIRVTRDAIYASTQAQRTYMLYLLVFAGLGLLLSAIGIYGVLAYSVARRTREIGIRMAVGADRRRLLRMVMAQGARLVVTGGVVALVCAFALTRYLRSQLYEVSPSDPTVMAAVVLVLFAVTLLACWIPARRASRIDPMVALRSE